jgi:L-ascorbate metabolism protein UlaG (beta-lactamase superfamily)
MNKKLAALLAVASLGVVGAWSAESAGPTPTASPAGVTLTWLGTAGWQISDGNTVILVDPYLSRLRAPPPPGAAPLPAGDTRPEYGWDGRPESDRATIDAHIQRADFVLVTHAHFDHIFDVPYIVKRTGATVIGTESTANILRAYGMPERQLITVRGGEDYQFNGFSLRVIPSLHSPIDHKHYFSSQTAPSGMKSPLTLEQMHPEGGTLGYLVRIGGHEILAFGGMNYIERELEGLRPDVVLVGANASRRENYDYCGRLMRVLGYPALVLPTHWDNFLLPYDASQRVALEALQGFLGEVTAASPHTRVVVPQYFEAIPLPPRESSTPAANGR